MGGRTDKHMPPTRPSSHHSGPQHVDELLVDAGPHGRNSEPGKHTSFRGSDCTRARWSEYLIGYVT